MEKSRKPKIRFKGFTDDWEQRKLEEIVQITMGQSPDGSTYSNEPSDYILIQGNADLLNGWVSPRIWTTQITKKADAGDLIMSVRAPAGSMGKTAYDAVIGRGVAAIKGNEFIYQLLVKMDEVGYWKTFSCGSTFESLSSDTIKNAKVNVTLIAEQTQIGLFLNQLDSLITLHQRKLDKLVNVKKSMLEKMFPQQGSRIPEIRFCGFTDDWEQRKLSDDVSSIDTGKSKFDTKESGDCEILGSTGVIGYDDSFDYEGDFLLTARVGANAGTLYRHSGKVKITDNTVFLQGSHIDFVFYLLNKFDLKKMSFGSGQPLIKASELKYLKLMMPVQNEEKEKIATYFLNLDSLITLHQRKLEKLKNIKKSMLEKMFI